MAQLVKTVGDLAIASVKTVMDLAIASNKTINGLDNTAAGGVPTGNAFTFTGDTSANALIASGTTMPATTTTITTNAGELVVFWIKWEDQGDVTAMSNSHGTVVLTAKENSGAAIYSRWGYILSASAATATISITTTGSPAFGRIIYQRFSYSGTASLDTNATGAGSSGNPATGAFTTGTVNGVTVMGYGEYSSYAPTTRTIGGSTATPIPTTQPLELTWSFYRLNAAQISSGTGNLSGACAAAWLLSTISFKAL